MHACSLEALHAVYLLLCDKYASCIRSTWKWWIMKFLLTKTMHRRCMHEPFCRSHNSKRMSDNVLCFGVSRAWAWAYSILSDQIWFENAQKLNEIFNCRILPSRARYEIAAIQTFGRKQLVEHEFLLKISNADSLRTNEFHSNARAIYGEVALILTNAINRDCESTKLPTRCKSIDETFHRQFIRIGFENELGQSANARKRGCSDWIIHIEMIHAKPNKKKIDI